MYLSLFILFLYPDYQPVLFMPAKRIAYVKKDQTDSGDHFLRHLDPSVP